MACCIVRSRRRSRATRRPCESRSGAQPPRGGAVRCRCRCGAGLCGARHHAGMGRDDGDVSDRPLPEPVPVVRWPWLRHYRKSARAELGKGPRLPVDCQPAGRVQAAGPVSALAVAAGAVPRQGADRPGVVPGHDFTILLGRQARRGPALNGYGVVQNSPAWLLAPVRRAVRQGRWTAAAAGGRRRAACAEPAPLWVE
jgi:hypothetical protein